MKPEITHQAQLFVQRFSSTAHGARAARLVAVDHLGRRGMPHHHPAVESAALLIAELAANAVTHGALDGRDFELRIMHNPHSDEAALRIEVSDSSSGRLHMRRPDPTATCGRGLLLVDAIADRWGVDELPDGGKIVWAVLSLANSPQHTL